MKRSSHRTSFENKKKLLPGDENSSERRPINLAQDITILLDVAEVEEKRKELMKMQEKHEKDNKQAIKVGGHRY